MERWLNHVWYSGARPPVWLRMLSGACLAGCWLRQLARRAGLSRCTHPGVTTIVVGNLTVGGTGKTPFVLALSRLLVEDGLRVGLITRGYGGRARDWPREVFADSAADELGDEAVLLAQGTDAPVYAGPDRVAAARALLARHAVDVLISDDGLQHGRLGRDIEIVMIDPERGFGNGRCLPAGPLREPLSRLETVDATVALRSRHPAARFQVRVEEKEARNIREPARTRPLSSFAGAPCRALTGIAHPEGFFRSLRRQGLEPVTTVYHDHHAFSARDICFDDDLPVLMTAKDAVKCQDFAGEDVWYVPQQLDVGPAFRTWLHETLKRKTDLG